MSRRAFSVVNEKGTTLFVPVGVVSLEVDMMTIFLSSVFRRIG